MQQRNALQAIKKKCFQHLKLFQTSTVRDHSLFLRLKMHRSIPTYQMFYIIHSFHIIKAFSTFSHLHRVHRVFLQSERQVRNSTAPADKAVWQQQRRRRKETLLLYSHAGSGDAAGCLTGNWIFSHKWIQSIIWQNDRQVCLHKEWPLWTPLGCVNLHMHVKRRHEFPEERDFANEISGFTLSELIIEVSCFSKITSVILHELKTPLIQFDSMLIRLIQHHYSDDQLSKQSLVKMASLRSSGVDLAFPVCLK